MTNADIARRRLHHQRLTGTKFHRPEEVVRWLGAVQAQDYPGALWSVGLRMGQATEAQVERALADRKIVRTWPMRGTLHFVAPEDARWMLQLLAPRVISRLAGYYRQAGLTEATFAKSKDLFSRVLEGGQQLTRKELYDILERAKIPTRHMRGLFILGYLAMEGFLIFGARRGKQHTFALLEEWLPQAKTLSPEESLARLTKRYFTSHGPATLRDLMWWSGLTTAEARTGVEMVKGSLRQEVIDGIAYWQSSESPARKNPSPTAYLLQGYDEYVIAYKDRSAVVDPADLQRMIAMNVMLGPPMVVDGRVVGLWKRVFKKREVMITTTPFRRFSKSETRVVSAAAERYGRFLNVPVRLER